MNNKVFSRGKDKKYCIFIQSIAHHKLQIITFFDNTLFKSLLHLLPQNDIATF